MEEFIIGCCYFTGGATALAPLTVGIILTFFPPKKINYLWGFGTEAAMKNKQTWDYANKLCGKVMLIYSLLSLAPLTVLLIVFHNFFYSHAYLVSISGFVLVIGALLLAVYVQKKTVDYGDRLAIEEMKKEKETPVE